MSSEVQRLASILAQLQGDVSSLARERRLTHASLEGGGINVYQPGTGGQPGVTLGQQYDGTYGAAPLAGPVPPMPSQPSAEVSPGTLAVSWAGTFAGGPMVVAPMDFARVEIHVSTNPDMDGLSANTLRDTFESPRGGSKTITGLETGEYWVCLTTRSLTGRYSARSAVAGPYPVTSEVDAAEALAEAQAATALAQDAATRADAAEAAALDAAGIAADAGHIVYSSSAPTGDPNTLWYKLPENVPHRWDGDSWEPLKDPDILAAANAAAAAETAADEARAAAEAAQNTASAASGQAQTALTTAQGKNTVTYSTAIPDSTLNPGIRAGDIWYQRATTGTQAGVITGTWEWDGTAWVSRTYGDAVLKSLTAGKITVGTMSADITIAGRFATALTGSRVEVNALGLQKFAADGVTKLVSITGSEALMSGIYRSNPSGQRVEINSTFNRQDSATPSTYYAGLRMFVGGSDYYFGELASWSQPGKDFYTTQLISPGATAFNGSYLRLQGSGTNTGYDSAIMYGSNTVGISAQNLVELQSVNNDISLIASGIQFNNPDGYIRIGRGSGSPIMTFNGFGLGGGGGILGLKVFTGGDGYGTGLSVLNPSDTGYYNIRCGNVYQASDESVKTDIVEAPESLLAEVLGTTVYEYAMRDDGPDKVKRRHRGVLAHEMSDRIRVRGNPEATSTDALDMVDTYALTVTTLGAIKEMWQLIDARLKALETRAPSTIRRNP